MRRHPAPHSYCPQHHIPASTDNPLQHGVHATLANASRQSMKAAANRAVHRMPNCCSEGYAAWSVEEWNEMLFVDGGSCWLAAGRSRCWLLLHSLVSRTVWVPAWWVPGRRPSSSASSQPWRTSGEEGSGREGRGEGRGEGQWQHATRKMQAEMRKKRRAAGAVRQVQWASSRVCSIPPCTLHSPVSWVFRSSTNDCSSGCNFFSFAFFPSLSDTKWLRNPDSDAENLILPTKTKKSLSRWIEISQQVNRSEPVT